MLTLPIKKQWFDLILRGEKKEEYREIKPYYTKRFINILAPHWNDFEHGEKFFQEECESNWYGADNFDVKFRNGYAPDSPSFTAKVQLTIGTGRKEWGAEPGKKYYVLKIVNMKGERVNGNV